MTKSAEIRRRPGRVAVPGRGHPPSRQVGALCWRRCADRGLRILLITSRDTGRWVIPKGWPMRRRSEAGAAAREAWEEAGISGEIAERSIGVFTYRKFLDPKRWIPCVVRVFPMHVTDTCKDFPECGERRLKWFSPEKAARKVQESDLAAMIRAFDPETPPRAEASRQSVA